MEPSHGITKVVNHLYFGKSSWRISLSNCDDISVHRVDTNLVILSCKETLPAASHCFWCTTSMICRVGSEWRGFRPTCALCLLHVSKSLRTRCAGFVNSIHSQKDYCLLQCLRVFKYVSNLISSFLFWSCSSVPSRDRTSTFQGLKSKLRSHPDSFFFAS